MKLIERNEPFGLEPLVFLGFNDGILGGLSAPLSNGQNTAVQYTDLVLSLRPESPGLPIFVVI